MRGSAMNRFMPSSRTCRDGHTTHEKTTDSPGSSFTAMGNEVILPSGTSSPQHSITLRAPNSLNKGAAFSAALR